MANWKKVKGYTNYSVSDEGQVRNDKTMKALSPAFDSNGYLFVILCENGTRWHGYIHQLVATAFIPNFRDLCEVNHKDENKRNNHKNNLEWCTHSENIKHSLARRAVAPKRAVLCIETGRAYSSIEAAAKAVGRSHTALWKCLNGMTKTCAGLHWRCLYDCESRSDSRGEGYDLWLCKTRWEEYFGVPEEQSAV